MRQFILPADWDGRSAVAVEGDRARYVSRVLRLGPGDRFPARDSGGHPWSCLVLESGPGRLLLSVEVSAEGPRGHAGLSGQAGPAPRIILVQAVPKGAKMDLVFRQAAEAGVYAVLPLLSARSAARGEEGGANRRSRWERIVREALQQSGSGVPTEVGEPLELAALPGALESMGLRPEDPRILLHEAPLAQSSMHGYLTGDPEAVALCVGPEGGFAPDEVDILLAAGWKPLRLAGAILRAETAALYAIAAAQIILSERSSWTPKPS